MMMICTNKCSSNQQTSIIMSTTTPELKYLATHNTEFTIIVNIYKRQERTEEKCKLIAESAFFSSLHVSYLQRCVTPFKRCIMGYLYDLAWIGGRPGQSNFGHETLVLRLGVVRHTPLVRAPNCFFFFFFSRDVSRDGSWYTISCKGWLS